ncbi:MAG: universal stress protein [Bacteroidales bacterium]|nr:universal stress protein [Bacteroidales bacterium]MDT8432846.1 universal stress protein [Bacteroidales bacterium]
MKLLQNILVPMDFNASSINALHYAANISEAFNSRLILLHVITEKVTRGVPYSFIATKSQDIAKSWFESNLGEVETYLKKARDTM